MLVGHLWQRVTGIMGYAHECCFERTVRLSRSVTIRVRAELPIACAAFLFCVLLRRRKTDSVGSLPTLTPFLSIFLVQARQCISFPAYSGGLFS